VASIERTAYPRFKRRPSAQELTEVYTPSAEELVFIREHARGPSPTLTVAVLLKSVQRLATCHACGTCPSRSSPTFGPACDCRRTLRSTWARGRSIATTPQFAISSRFGPGGPEARHVAISAVHAAAAVQDHPADLINVAIEELVRQRYELPAFSALDRLVQRVRTLVHARLFQLVLGRLSDDDQQLLDGLLHAGPSLLALTKFDDAEPEAVEHLAKVFPDMPVVTTSVLDDVSLARLRAAAWQLTGLIRVYVRGGGDPFALPKGSTVLDVAAAIHSQLVRDFRGARIWGPSARFQEQRVGRDHVVLEGDTVEVLTP
jgi:hypothetical protein